APHAGQARRRRAPPVDDHARGAAVEHEVERARALHADAHEYQPAHVFEGQRGDAVLARELDLRPIVGGRGERGGRGGRGGRSGPGEGRRAGTHRHGAAYRARRSVAALASRESPTVPWVPEKHSAVEGSGRHALTGLATPNGGNSIWESPAPTSSSASSSRSRTSRAIGSAIGRARSPTTWRSSWRTRGWRATPTSGSTT